jgi:hypothetical protein
VATADPATAIAIATPKRLTLRERMVEPCSFICYPLKTSQWSVTTVTLDQHKFTISMETGIFTTN